LRTIIEIVTDDNISGISEIPGNIKIDAYLEKSRELVVGEDPFQMNRIKQQLFDRFGQDEADKRGDNPWDSRTLVHVFSAIEVACLDIQGKICGRPVVDLLGGRCQDSVPFDAYLFYKKKGAGGRVKFDGGQVVVPREPGLGIELNHNEVERLYKQYKACGLTRRDDTAEMKKLEPTWEYKPVRW